MQVFSCGFCEICINTFFLKYYYKTASKYSSINSTEEKLITKSLNYNTKIKSIGTDLSQKSQLSKMAVPVKEQVSEAVVSKHFSK